MTEDHAIAAATHALQNSGIVVARTDTIYGLLAKASDEAAVERVYDTKGRTENKACIILVKDPADIPFNQDVIAAILSESNRPTSIIVPVSGAPGWLTRGGDTLAYRILPPGHILCDIIDETGPLIAPSANPEGLPPAININQAKSYFGDKVNVYLDGGEVPTDVIPSRIIKIRSDNTYETIRD
ncbi:hypothetical protein B7Y94_01465 [Candidatus Saccharibacteria bacterium 32-49-12]|nr:MAG: hypothetical protein B7Y94_01465 [Candidatus Saccharibacteria bacterium 32-49-12]